MKTLHDYQQDVVNGAFDLWKRGHRRIAAVMATGGGKTVTFSWVIRAAVAAGAPILVLAHRRELIFGAAATVAEVNPDATVGVLLGSRKEWRSQVVVGSIQTASTPTTLARLKLRQWGLIVIDETHHVVATTYMRILRELGAYDADGPRVLGVTATLDRADGQALGQVFEAVVEPQVGLLELIRRGFLVPPRGVRVKIDNLDLDKVKRVAGDFNSSALGQAMSDAMAPKRIVESYLEHCPDAPAVAFLPTVAVSIEVAEAFNAAGVVAVHLDGSTPDAVRDQALEDFRAGRIQVLCNVGLFLEGTDLPLIRCVILGRPTSSPTVYVQQVGRGLRTHAESGKKFCWVLDCCGVTGRHRLATMANLFGADRPEDIPDELLMYEEDFDQDQEPDDEPSGEVVETTYVDGAVSYEEISLFGESASTWLQTAAGTWFVPAGSVGYLFLQPTPDGNFELTGITHAAQRYTLTDPLPLARAQAAGDEVVAANPIWQADRAAAWRLTRGRGGRTRGEIFDEKAIAAASALIDGGTM